MVYEIIDNGKKAVGSSPGQLVYHVYNHMLCIFPLNTIKLLYFLYVISLEVRHIASGNLWHITVNIYGNIYTVNI